MAEKILGRLKFPSSDIKQVAWLIHYHLSIGQLDEMRPSKRLSFLTNPKFNDLIELVEADSKGTYPINLELVSKIQNDKQNVLRELNLKKKIINKVDFITGEDLIKLGMKPGSKFKEILEKIADLQIEGEIRSKQEGIEYIKKNYL